MKAALYAVNGKACPSQPCPLRHVHDHQRSPEGVKPDFTGMISHLSSLPAAVAARIPRRIRPHIETLEQLHTLVRAGGRTVVLNSAIQRALEATLDWLLPHLASPHAIHFDGCPKPPAGGGKPFTITEAAAVRHEMATAAAALARVLGIYARTPRDTSDSAGQHEVAEAFNAVRCWSMFAPTGGHGERGDWGIWCIDSNGHHGHWYAGRMPEAEAVQQALKLNMEVRYEARRHQ